ncbi:MAG: beta-N-acetylhexosaminidase [Bacteroidales bacterium]|nr:beta-N-acetylhexosaminidase [Bacteroidales bacterium]
MKRYLLYALAALALVSCSKSTPQPFQVIPMPNEVAMGKGVFSVKGTALVVDPALDDASKSAVNDFVQAVETATGKGLHDGDGGFSFTLDPSLEAEEYLIRIDKRGAAVFASALNGFVYACETLKQMLPAQIYGGRKAKADWVLPFVTIKDKPRFGYRGMHMDPCRHFWSIDEVKRYIDVMATYKLNRLHWHLTDDQGWRIEIKRYPRLTEVGGWRSGTMVGKDFSSSDGIRYGGFYTQDQLREVVAYAAAKGITVIPEIDLPGHMVAALAAYPELGCTGGPYQVLGKWGVAKDILCAGNEEVFTFLENVLAEVMDIFPSKYIHIGGDECFDGDMEPGRPDPWDVCPKCAARMRSLGISRGPKAKHELQNYVTNRIQKYLNQHGRKIIGWDEILQGNLTSGATVMSWRGVEGGIEAASKGFDAIMTPTSYMYFDYYQGQERDKEPLSIGGYVPLEKVYSYEPLKGVPADVASHILGVQANLWTEYIALPAHLEYMLLPRLCALSEIQWCQEKDFDRFNVSLDHTFEILDQKGVNYSLDIRGKVGLDRKPARSASELESYLETNKFNW